MLVQVCLTGILLPQSARLRRFRMFLRSSHPLLQESFSPENRGGRLPRRGLVRAPLTVGVGDEVGTLRERMQDLVASPPRSVDSVLDMFGSGDLHLTYVRRALEIILRLVQLQPGQVIESSHVTNITDIVCRLASLPPAEGPSVSGDGYRLSEIARTVSLVQRLLPANARVACVTALFGQLQFIDFSLLKAPAPGLLNLSSVGSLLSACPGPALLPLNVVPFCELMQLSETLLDSKEYAITRKSLVDVYSPSVEASLPGELQLQAGGVHMKGSAVETPVIEKVFELTDYFTAVSSFSRAYSVSIPESTVQRFRTCITQLMCSGVISSHSASKRLMNFIERHFKILYNNSFEFLRDISVFLGGSGIQVLAIGPEAGQTPFTDGFYSVIPLIFLSYHATAQFFNTLNNRNVSADQLHGVSIPLHTVQELRDGFYKLVKSALAVMQDFEPHDILHVCNKLRGFRPYIGERPCQQEIDLKLRVRYILQTAQVALLNSPLLCEDVARSIIKSVPKALLFGAPIDSYFYTMLYPILCQVNPQSSDRHHLSECVSLFSALIDSGTICPTIGKRLLQCATAPGASTEDYGGQMVSLCTLALAVLAQSLASAWGVAAQNRGVGVPLYHNTSPNGHKSISSIIRFAINVLPHVFKHLEEGHGRATSWDRFLCCAISVLALLNAQNGAPLRVPVALCKDFFADDTLSASVQDSCHVVCIGSSVNSSADSRDPHAQVILEQYLQLAESLGSVIVAVCDHCRTSSSSLDLRWDTLALSASAISILSIPHKSPGVACLYTRSFPARTDAPPLTYYFSARQDIFGQPSPRTQRLLSPNGVPYVLGPSQTASIPQARVVVASLCAPNPHTIIQLTHCLLLHMDGIPCQLVSLCQPNTQSILDGRGALRV